MPLSEHEQRLLDQIERALYEDDPKFASTVRSTDLRTHMRRRLWRAGVVFVVGFLLLPVGVLQDSPLIGVVGFAIMVLALVLALAAWKRLGPGPAGRSTKPPKRQGRGSRRVTGNGGSGNGGSGGWRGRSEERWKKRWDERGRGQD